jgi:hypothetical protein
MPGQGDSKQPSNEPVYYPGLAEFVRRIGESTKALMDDLARKEAAQREETERRDREEYERRMASMKAWERQQRLPGPPIGPMIQGGSSLGNFDLPYSGLRSDWKPGDPISPVGYPRRMGQHLPDKKS